MKIEYDNLKKVIKFLLGSIFMLTLNLVLIDLFKYKLGLPYWLSLGTSQLIVIFSGFLYMNYVVFLKRDVNFKRFISHQLVLVLGLLLNMILGNIFVYILGKEAVVSTAFALMITAFCKFFLYYKFTYAS